MSSYGEEKRRHPRIPITARVTLKDGGETNYLFTKDLSVGGAALISEQPISLGTRVLMDFAIPNVKNLIKVEGVVVRYFSQSSEKGFGVKFTKFKPHSKRRLEKALAEHKNGKA